MPDIKFINSPKCEEKRWRSTKVEVGNGWFANHGFLVVPELIGEVEPQIQVILPKQIDYVPVEVKVFQDEWDRVEEGFWTELDHYLPEARKMHSQVAVDVGSIGTVSSSYWSCSRYYLREDRSIGDLAAMIINHVLFELRKDVGVTWTKREALMDFIMTRSVMKRLFPEFKPVFAQLSRIPMKWRVYSEKYVQELGIDTTKPDLEVKAGKIMIKGVMVGKELTKLEKQAIRLLIDHLGDLVTYDEIADKVWGEGEFKSFWAINKLVERMRPKLEKLGIDGKRIESVRGQGYLLK